MEMKTRLVDKVNIVDIIGRFDANTVAPVAAWLEQMTTKPGCRVLVNLSETTFADSTGLATLVQAMKRAQQHQGEIYLCGMRRSVYMTFELTRLDKAFTIFADEEHALKAFAK
ncbi:STAS domain-containing protein [Candidatus Chloroploca sp. Khr17]|uniref:STAS domain-containing protein n=1 Tax=Candidatus Chloroploca sp. Khr17 TaxID=2496869 RepID=UPI00101B5CF6|nr:STAS domain-containing protein [Candidatus Chloroploca sp. Khr17]